MSVVPELREGEAPPLMPAPNWSDALLVDACLADEPGAFDEFVQRHGSRVFHYIHHMVGQVQDAEDLTQQTFIKVFANLHRIDTSRPLIGWVLTIARRTALNHFRSARYWEPVTEEIPTSTPSPARQAEDRDRIDSLWVHARHALTPREYEILWLRFAEDLSVAETARVVGLTQTHVKIIVFRARRTLMKLPPLP